VRILFDQGTPAPLRRFLLAHNVATAAELNWSDLANGELLRAAETQFDAFITTDKNLRYQQNVANRRLAILVLPFTSWPKLQAHLPQIVGAIDRLRPGDYEELPIL
jgi:hypothetical protein